MILVYFKEGSKNKNIVEQLLKEYGEEFKEVGDHYLYICKVDSVFETENEKALFAFNEYSKIDVIK